MVVVLNSNTKGPRFNTQCVRSFWLRFFGLFYVCILPPGLCLASFFFVCFMSACPNASGYPPTAIGYPPTAIGYPPTAIVGRIGHSEFFFFFITAPPGPGIGSPPQVRPPSSHHRPPPSPGRRMVGLSSENRSCEGGSRPLKSTRHPSGGVGHTATGPDLHTATCCPSPPPRCPGRPANTPPTHTTAGPSRSQAPVALVFVLGLARGSKRGAQRSSGELHTPTPPHTHTHTPTSHRPSLRSQGGPVSVGLPRGGP